MDYPFQGLSLVSFAENPLFAATGPSKDDVFQGGGGDCYFLSTLSALAALADANPDFIRKTLCVLKTVRLMFVFFNKNGEETFVRVTTELWVDNSGTPRYSKPGRQGSIWVPIVEKAFAICRHNQNSYNSTGGAAAKR